MYRVIPKVVRACIELYLKVSRSLAQQYYVYYIISLKMSDVAYLTNEMDILEILFIPILIMVVIYCYKHNKGVV